MSEIWNSLTPELIAQRKKAHAICREFSRDPSKGNLKKLRQIFSACGDHTFIEYGFHCDYGNRICLGERVYINTGCTFLDGGIIRIGDDCLIAPKVQILTVSHSKDAEQRLLKLNYTKNVTIGNNVWIGAGAIILPGVNIDDNAIIGAGSVVTRNVSSGKTVAGNPAREI